MSRTDGWALPRLVYSLESLEKWPLNQEPVAEQLLGTGVAVSIAGCLAKWYLSELARVVPLVDGVGGVNPFVAL